MLKKLFEDQRAALNAFFDRIEIKKAQKLLERLQLVKGTIFLTGVGKSSYVARKIAVTLTSTGTRALYLSPTDALHGDIGIVSPEDTFIFLSKSGESEELLNLIPALRNKGAYLVALVCKEGSRLQKACDEMILLPLTRELCPFDLAPTTSTAIQMIFGDTLAVALMQAKGFEIEEYKLNHPAGRIGRQMLLKVADLMLTGDQLPLCTPNAILVDMLVELSKKQAGCLIIVENGKLCGIFTDGDLRRALEKEGAKALDKKMRDLMVPCARTIDPEALATLALHEMEKNQKSPITVLPVVDKEKKLLGLIKMHDILQSGI